MFDSWSVLKDDQEIEIIRKHANNGKYFTLVATSERQTNELLVLMIQLIIIEIITQ